MAAKHKGRIHLLLTDVVMPEMSGPQAAGADPRAASRHEGAVHVRATRTRPLCITEFWTPAQPFLQKPFLPDALARKVREVLNTEAAAG
jgi:two-component system cell cycle sensor histidine kinase/response regulator CckA